MALNVPAVNDIFLRPMRKNAKHFYVHKKNMLEQNTTKGAESPTGVLRNPSRRRTKGSQAAKR